MGILVVAFVIVQILTPETALIPKRVIKQRSTYTGFLASTFIGAAMYIESKSRLHNCLP
jgi:hypothetical protein